MAPRLLQRPRPAGDSASAQVRADPPPVRAGSQVRTAPPAAQLPAGLASWPQSPLASGSDTEGWKPRLLEAGLRSAPAGCLFLKYNL